VQDTDIDFQKLIPIGSSEPTLGFIILRAVNYVIGRHTLQHYVEQSDQEFAVMVRMRKVDIRITSDSGANLSINGHYEHVRLSSTPSHETSPFDIKSAFSQFALDFHFFVEVSCAEPVPGFVTRICRCHRMPVVEAEGLELWDCPVAGLVFEEDTCEVATNPFD